jgi:DNA-3-methyladenine glycosylase
MPIKLSHSFFKRKSLLVAREILGKRLVRILDGERLSGTIVEVEAYIGQDDQASHARPGRTARNASMFGPPGHAYVYLIYGIHHCLNIVTEREGYPAALLIRALEPQEGLETMRERRGGRSDLPLTSGPARLCQALAVDRKLDGADLCAPEASLFLEKDLTIPDEAIATGPRIGVRGDEVALSVPWRFYIQNNPHVSR